MAQEFTDPSFAEVDTLLRGHPKVRECAVASIVVGPGRTVIAAYVVTTEKVETSDLQRYLQDHLPSGRVPRAIIPVPALPRSEDGELEYSSLPLPVWPGYAAGGKSGGFSDMSPSARGCLMAAGTFVTAFMALLLTGVFWPYSTDLSGVPEPWAGLFFGLYLCECLSFGLGLMFLFFGRPVVTQLGRPPGLTTLAHLAIVWLLVAWWPQDNFYRLTAKTDWPRQAALVYGFNITLMVAAAVVVAFVATRRNERKS